MSVSHRSNVQLTGDELQQLRWLLGGLLTLVSVATVFYLDIAAWTLLTLTAVGLILVMVWPWLPGRIPRWAHRLAFPIIVAVFTTDLWLSGELLPSLVRLDILLLLYRGISYRQKRDDLQIVVLGLFLLVVAGVLTVSLTFAVHILAFTAGALALLLVITLSDASNATASVPLPAGSTPDWARQVEWRRLLGRVWQVTDWRVVTMGTALFAGLVGLSAVLFVAIPRFQLENGLFLERFITKKSLTGFSDSIKFGDVTDIQQDNSVALNVDVSDRTQIPDAPYWRMLVLDEYREGTFRLSAALRRDGFSGDQRGRQVRGARRAKPGETAIWVFYLKSGVSRYLPLLGAFERLRFSERQSYQSMREIPLVALREDPVTMIAYEVQGMVSEPFLLDPHFGGRFASRGHDPAAADTFMLSLALAEADRVTLAQITGTIAGEEQLSAEEFSQRATAWLGKRDYTLQPRIPAGPGDPLVRWLNSNEGGHCELFAGSLVVLARSAGFPARVVTGFYGGSWNGYSNNFMIRNSDAHAWCEVFDAKTQSWLRVDPTPGGGGEQTNRTGGEEVALARRNDRSWTARLESLRVFWYRHIVSFDQNSQIQTFNAVKHATENSGRQMREMLDRWGEKIRAWFVTPWSGRRLVGSVGVFAGLTIAVLLAIQAYRYFKYRTWGTRRGGSGDRARREAGRWLVKLSGLRAEPDASVGKEQVIRELQRIRFGMRETWGEVAPVLGRARKAWRQEKREQRRRRRGK